MKVENIEQKKFCHKLVERLDNGEKILVRFIKEGWENSYLDTGMKAYIVGYSDFGYYSVEDESSFEEEIVNFQFDFSDFIKENKKINPHLTSTQEDFFISTNLNSLPFVVLLEKSEPFRKLFKNSKTTLDYTSWLEQQLQKFYGKNTF